MPLQEALIKRFIQFRKKHIGNQSETAIVCECSQKNISEIESGLTTISLEIVIMLYMKKKLNPDWFFEGGQRPWIKDAQPKGSTIFVIENLKGEIEVMKKYIEQMQKIMKKLVSDVYAKNIEN